MNRRRFFLVLLLAVLTFALVPTTSGHAAEWGDPSGLWNARKGKFKPSKNDTIKLNDFSTWDPYQADVWTKGDKFNYHLAKFTVDDNNAYGWIRMQDPSRWGNMGNYTTIQPNSYYITVNGKKYIVNLVYGATNRNYDGNHLRKGEGEWVDVQVVDESHNWYSSYILKAAYVYRNRDGVEEMSFAIPFAALGKGGTEVNQSTQWNFNQTDQLNDGKGINYEGASTAPWFLVAAAVVCVAGGAWFVQRRGKLNAQAI